MPHKRNNGDEIVIAHPCYSGSSETRSTTCPPYCDCDFPTAAYVTYFNGYIPDLIKCRCAEDDPATHTLQWKWHQSNESDLLINGPEITFHPTFSQGTAIARGDKPLATGMIHFWEMRILTVLSGTDVMFGVGTDEVDYTKNKFKFVSGLGNDAHSWAFSFEGKIHHKSVQLKYGKKFSQGCIVGILLDRVRGQLEFFLNRRSLGVAYTNIPTDPNVKIYPMVCSTAAKSCTRLINAISQAECLQLRAFAALVKQPKSLTELRQLPGLRTILNNYWFLDPPVRYSRESNEYDMLDEAVMSSKTRLSRKHKYKDEDTDDDINDLYRNAHKIAARRENETEIVLSEYFDEYFNYLF